MKSAVWYGSALAVAGTTAYLLVVVRHAHVNGQTRAGGLCWLSCVAIALLLPLFLRRLLREPADITLVAGPAMIAALVVSVMTGTFASVIALYVVAVAAIWAVVAAFAAFEENARQERETGADGRPDHHRRGGSGWFERDDCVL